MHNADIIDSIYNKYSNIIKTTKPVRLKGKVKQVVGLIIESSGPSVSVGERCELRTKDGRHSGYAEVIGFRDDRILLMPLGELYGIAPGSEVIATGEPYTVPVGEKLLGRVVDALGNPIDGKGPLEYERKQIIYNDSPKPMERKRIVESIATGVKAIDSVLTLGKGQRVGIFSGSGVGKSILMGMITRNTNADINVIGLIGERGREVKEFVEEILGEEGLKRSVVVAVTSDQPALLRVKGAYVATAIAEYFRDKGSDVMLFMDSATRIAMAQREIGLSAGEPPTTKGYPPSVFALLPKLLERAGYSGQGSMTAIYTVLVEGDDLNEPISDNLRAILDGHISLSRRLASANHYPAIDILESISRLMIDVVSDEHRKSAMKLIDLVSTYREAEDLINIGAYVKGSNPKIDIAIEMIDQINSFLRQDIFERTEFKETVTRLNKIMENVNIH